MPEVKWIKITTDMFDDEKIKLIRKLPEADAIIAIWIQLICLAGKCNSAGYIFLNEEIPYNEETLSAILQRELPIVRLSLKTMSDLRMIKWENGQHLQVINFDKYQNVEGLETIREHARLRQQKHRLLLRENSPVTTLSRDITSLDKSREDKIREEKNIYTENKYLKENEIRPGLSIEDAIEIAEGRKPANRVNYEFVIGELDKRGISYAKAKE